MNLDNTVCSPEWRICWLHLASQAYQDKDVEDYETKERMLIMMTKENVKDDYVRRSTWQRAEHVKYSSGKDVCAKELTSE